MTSLHVPTHIISPVSCIVYSPLPQPHQVYRSLQTHAPKPGSIIRTSKNGQILHQNCSHELLKCMPSWTSIVLWHMLANYSYHIRWRRTHCWRRKNELIWWEVLWQDIIIIAHALNHIRSQFVPKTIDRQSLIMCEAKVHAGAHTHVQPSTIKIVRDSCLEDYYLCAHRQSIQIDTSYPQLRAVTTCIKSQATRCANNATHLNIQSLRAQLEMCNTGHLIKSESVVQLARLI
jgi:hypothetical protein